MTFPQSEFGKVVCMHLVYFYQRLDKALWEFDKLLKVEQTGRFQEKNNVGGIQLNVLEELLKKKPKNLNTKLDIV